MWTKFAAYPFTQRIMKPLVNLQMSMYLNTVCPNCRKEFKNLDDLENSVWWGSQKYPACCSKKCFKELAPISLLTSKES